MLSRELLIFVGLSLWMCAQFFFFDFIFIPLSIPRMEATCNLFPSEYSLLFCRTRWIQVATQPLESEPCACGVSNRDCKLRRYNISTPDLLGIGWSWIRATKTREGLSLFALFLHPPPSPSNENKKTREKKKKGCAITGAPAGGDLERLDTVIIWSWVFRVRATKKKKLD